MRRFLAAGVHGRDKGWRVHDQPKQFPALELRLGTAMKRENPGILLGNHR